MAHNPEKNVGAFYLFLRGPLLLLDNTLGARNPRLRSVCAYLCELIVERRNAELRAVFRHAVNRVLRLAPGGAGAPRRVYFPVPIDVRSEILSPDGRIRAKGTTSFPNAGASVLVSVVIPCYNYGRFLPFAVASVRAQTLWSKEIIVVDDGSTDSNTQVIVDALAAEPDVHVIRQSNKGLSAARNAGIQAAHGEYICCLDADDLIEPTYLEQTVAVLESDPSVGFAYSWAQFFGDTVDLWQTRDFEPSEALLGNHTLVAAVFRRDDWGASGGYSEEMAGGFEDWEFWIRLASLGRRGRAIRFPLFRHRRHGRTMTHTAKAIQGDLQARIRRLNPSFFQNTALRRRLKRLSPKTRPKQPFARLAPPRIRDQADRPGLLVVVAWLRRGGAETLLLDILRGLAASWHITVVTTRDDPHPMTDEFRAVTSEIYHLDGFLEPSLWGEFVDYLIQTRHVAAILASGSSWLLAEAATIKAKHPEIRLLNILHNHIPDGPTRAAIRADRWTDRHIAVSSIVTNMLTGCGVARERIEEIPNGIDLDSVFTPSISDRATSREELNLGGDQLVLLWIGRLAPEKRPLVFVEIVAELAKEHNVAAIMIGDGPLNASVTSLIEQRDLSGRVRHHFHLPRHELPVFYGAADFLVLPSAFEGMPLVVLEALAMGCPVAATDVGDVPQVVHNGISGLIVSKATPLALVEPIASIAHDADALKSMRARAAEVLKGTAYSRAEMIKRYEDLLLSPVRSSALPVRPADGKADAA